MSNLISVCKRYVLKFIILCIVKERYARASVGKDIFYTASLKIKHLNTNLERIKHTIDI